MSDAESANQQQQADRRSVTIASNQADMFGNMCIIENSRLIYLSLVSRSDIFYSCKSTSLTSHISLTSPKEHTQKKTF